MVAVRSNSTNRSPPHHFVAHSSSNFALSLSSVPTSPNDSAALDSDHHSEIVSTSLDLRLSHQNDWILSLSPSHLSWMLPARYQRLLQRRRTEMQEISYILLEMLELLEGIGLGSEGSRGGEWSLGVRRLSRRNGREKTEKMRRSDILFLILFNTLCI